MLIALAGLLAIGVAGSAGAATLDFTGTLSLQIALFDNRTYPAFVVPGTGKAQVTDDGSLHLLSLSLAGGTFGPINMSLPATEFPENQSVRVTQLENLTGFFSGISGGPPGGGAMGLQGVAKICLIFASDCGSAVRVWLTPTAGGAGFGIGGTAIFPDPGGLTMLNAPWTIGQPTMTIHTPFSTITTPVLPAGFAHGPASLTSSTAQTSGALQLVTASKLSSSFLLPEFPMTGVLTLHFVPEPGTLLLLSLGVVGLAVYGGRKRTKR